MTKLFMVGVGGFAGAVCRYIVFEMSGRLFPTPFIPYGTLFVNVAGCLLIGFFGGIIETRALFPPEIRALVLIGFLGGFTTYSTFGFELFTLARQGLAAAFFTHTILHLALGLSAVFCGMSISRYF